MVLAMMTFARMICVYPPLAAKHIENMKEMGYVSKEHMDGTKYSSKMYMVIENLVSRKDNGNRKIVFTTFKEEIDYLRNQLINYGIKTDFIDGRISKGQRNAILKSDVDVLILQIKTGNEGLNLQEYSEVYFVTPNWNPKVEEQAIARCHRLGQTKKVNVFRFVMNSFDEQLKTQNIEMYSEFVQNEKIDMESSIVK
jgi:SNF2 family DNA or RNA helicase